MLCPFLGVNAVQGEFTWLTKIDVANTALPSNPSVAWVDRRRMPALGLSSRRICRARTRVFGGTADTAARRMRSADEAIERLRVTSSSADVATGITVNAIAGTMAKMSSKDASPSSLTAPSRAWRGSVTGVDRRGVTDHPADDCAQGANPLLPPTREHERSVRAN